MKKNLIGVLIGIAVPLIGAFSYLRLGMPEVRADIPPGRWENYLMNAGMHASVRREAPNAPSPVPPTDENLIAGENFTAVHARAVTVDPASHLVEKDRSCTRPFRNCRWSGRRCLKRKFSGWQSTGSAGRGCSLTESGHQTHNFGQSRITSST